MPNKTRIVAPGPSDCTVRTDDGQILQAPSDWELHAKLAEQMADAVTRHATPVGSGTVARTQRIPIERRAESAVIAWLRHQTTAYDNMKIARVKGKRREVRRMLAEQSRRLLEKYRAGRAVGETCPLLQALLNAVSPDGD